MMSSLGSGGGSAGGSASGGNAAGDMMKGLGMDSVISGILSRLGPSPTGIQPGAMGSTTPMDRYALAMKMYQGIFGQLPAAQPMPQPQPFGSGAGGGGYV